MKMTLKEANERYLALSKMADRTFPAKLGFAIAANMEKLEKECNRTEQERVKLCKLYAEKDEDNNPKMIDSVVSGRPMKSYDISDQNRELLKKDLEACARLFNKLDPIMHKADETPIATVGI